MDRIFQPMRHRDQRRNILRVLASDGVRHLGIQRLVDLVFDLGQFGLALHFPDPPRQGEQAAQRRVGRFLPAAKEPPRGCEDRGQCAQHHRRQVNPVAVFIHEALLGAVVVGRGTRMDRDVGAGIGIGRRQSCQQRLVAHQIVAGGDQRLGQRRDRVRVELLVGHQISRRRAAWSGRRPAPAGCRAACLAEYRSSHRRLRHRRWRRPI